MLPALPGLKGVQGQREVKPTYPTIKSPGQKREGGGQSIQGTKREIYLAHWLTGSALA